MGFSIAIGYPFWFGMLILISHDIAWQNLPNQHKSTSVFNPGPLYPAFAIDPWFGGSPVGHFLGVSWSGGPPKWMDDRGVPLILEISI